MPLKSSTEPDAHLLRIGQIRKWSGCSEFKLREMVETGELGGAALWPGGHRYFLKEVVRHVLLQSSLSPALFGQEPEPELLRVYHVLAWTGLTEDQFRWAERRGAITGTALRPGGKRLYPKHLVRAAFFEPLVPATLRNLNRRDAETQRNTGLVC